VKEKKKNIIWDEENKIEGCTTRWVRGLRRTR
jgi:hypothetical protein